MAFSDRIKADMFQGISLDDMFVTLMLLVTGGGLREGAEDCTEDRPVLIELVNFQIVAVLLESLLGELAVVFRDGKL